ncbi:hypothetical protein ASPVEDRAFT_45954 [Aspergillus versicolor CBS 583.65]|uniref:2EXR domain-containing protein n=1 Tax=Aspergillus versicolor CBS 583.65 TaxID=1036611 RepID=A0A1L9PYK4_ASPVE|nr:uncharacterized protein ASPVEDRAFT_45954 [Aspergillus versicolor CBS 583.65]OJJ06597.1 hypothetical protein ASPVEDRAFT_45954 [Aspergillus versicolor CBS 583.65]
MSNFGKTFHLFPILPAEIRLAIWRLCLPHNRVMELDGQTEDLIWEECPCSKNWQISWTNRAPPLITRVCHESRAVAFETGAPQQLPDHTNPDTEQFSNSQIDNPWLDIVHDSVHLNWEPWVDIDWQSYDWGDPVRCLIATAARTRSGRASIMLSLLQVFQHRERPEESDPQFRWTRCGLAGLMRTRESWDVVILEPVIIHAAVEAAAGPFGLLADARVQLVDADDSERINTFMDLEKMPGVTIMPRLGQEDLATGKQELRDAVRAVFGSEDKAPVLRPVVMFRLCTKTCM